jgi:hypothetical protein
VIAPILKFCAPVSPDALTAILKFAPRLQKRRPDQVSLAVAESTVLSQ